MNERPTLAESGLDFKRYGYFTRPFSDSDQEATRSPNAARWRELEFLLKQLKGGRFSSTPALLMYFRDSVDWRLKGVAATLLGQTGAADIFRQMRSELGELSARKVDQIDVQTRELVLLYCRAFALWGRLDVVPVLLEQYLNLRLKATQEIALLPILIADLLTDDESSMIAHEPADTHIEEYLNLVMNEYDSVCLRLGSAQALVYRGALQSVRGLATRMRHLKTPYIATELQSLRERFEPATGIDCSAIFASSHTSSLAAATVAERFLDSPEADRYQDGIRYFFGHRIPD